MARVTVEDCVQFIYNRFELVGLASERARIIARGGPIFVEKDNDKNAVVALREIGGGKLEIPKIRDLLITRFQKIRPLDTPGEDSFHVDVPLSEMEKEIPTTFGESDLNDLNDVEMEDLDAEMDLDVDMDLDADADADADIDSDGMDLDD